MRLANDCAIDFGDLRADRGVDVADDVGRDRPAAPDTRREQDRGGDGDLVNRAAAGGQAGSR